MNRYIPFFLLLMAGSAAAAPPHPVFQVDPYWPKQMPHGYVFGPSGGVTVDSHDNVWIYSRPTGLRLTLMNPPNETSGQAAPSVVEISNDGRFIQGWGGVLAMSETERTQFDWPVQEHGIAVDTKGNVYGSGPGGVWIISPEGKHLATIKVPEVVSNVAWGDADGKTLYITASTSLYRIKLSVQGVRN